MRFEHTAIGSRMVAGSPPPKHMVRLSISLCKRHIFVCALPFPAARQRKEHGSSLQVAACTYTRRDREPASSRSRSRDKLSIVAVVIKPPTGLRGGPCNSRSRELHGQFYGVRRRTISAALYNYVIPLRYYAIGSVSLYGSYRPASARRYVIGTSIDSCG